MSIWKRTVSTLLFRVDKVIGEIENHEALIQAAIKEQTQNLAAAKVECNRVQKRQRDLSTNIDKLREKARNWERRAISEASENEERAIACVQQLETVTEEIARLSSMSDQYQAAIQKMSGEIKQGEIDLQELKQKHQFMRARQVTAEALGKFGDIGETRLEDIENSFDRWELKISQGELSLNADIDTELDDLEHQYVAQEKAEHLKTRLDELVSANSSNSEETEQ